MAEQIQSVQVNERESLLLLPSLCGRHAQLQNRKKVAGDVPAQGTRGGEGQLGPAGSLGWG